MKTKQLNRTDLSELVFIDDDKFELWRSSLSADKASIKNLYADSLSCATFALSSTSAENIQTIDISTENISAATGNVQRLNANELNITSVDGAVSSQTHIGLNDVYLYSGSDISGSDGLPEAYGFFSAATTSSDVWLSMSKLALDGKRQKLSVQAEGFSVLNEQLTTDNQVEESSYVELAFPGDLSGRHTLATRHDISSVLSGYIEKNDGNLDLNNISCRSILVSAETEADTEHVHHHSEIAVKTPRSNAYVASIYTEWEDGSRESDSRFLASNDGDIGGRDVFYFATGRFVGESQDPEKAGISVDAGYGYALAQTKDVQLGPDEERLDTEKRTRIDFVGGGNPSITASENIIKNQETTVSDRRLKIEVPLSDREGNQVMALRSDLSDYSYGKDELDQKLRPAANLSNICETIFDFGGGDVSAFGWTGLMTSGMLQQAGLKSDYGAWEKQPVFVRIGSFVSAVGDYTFQNCISLQSIDLANINGVGKYAFDNCAGIQAITLSPSINAIGQDAFRNTGLTRVKVEGKTQAEAERLLENTGLPEGCGVETWNFQPEGEYVQQSSLTGFATDDDGRNYGICLSSDGTAYVNVPWSGEISLSDVQATIFDFGDGDLSSFGWTGELSNQDLIDAGIKDSPGAVVKSPVAVRIGNGVTSIGNYVFWSCSRLTSMMIVNSVTSIGNSAFRNCRKLSSVTIGDCVTSIGDSAFSWCDGLTSVTIGDGVTSIGDHAFFNCDGLTSVTIPANVTSIGEWAFYDCTNLSEIKVEGKTQAEAEALLANADIPTGCQIKTWNFQPEGKYVQQSSLTGFATDDSAKNYKIDISSDGAAYIHVPWTGGGGGISLSDVQATIFDFGDGDLSSFGWTGELRFQDLIDAGIKASAQTVVKHPVAVRIGNGVTSIGDFTFQGCSLLTNVTIPTNVTSIGEAAFFNCSSLSSVTIGDGITNIGNMAFATTSLSNVTITNNVMNIGSWAFMQCTSLTSVTIGNSVTSIGDAAFERCSELAEIKVEGKTQAEAEALLTNARVPIGCRIKTWNYVSQEWVKEQDFVKQSSLTGFITDDSSRNYGICLSSDGTAYVNVPWSGSSEIPPEYKTYAQTSAQLSNDGYAMQAWVWEQSGRISLSDVQATIFDFGDGDLSSFGWTGVISQQNLIDAGIKDSIGDIVKHPVAVRIGNGVTSIGYRTFAWCRKLKSVTIPDSVTSIGEEAFSPCIKLTSITIPNGVTSIGEIAFNSSGLTKVTIPASVTIIGYHAFSGCNELYEITVEGKTKDQAEALLASAGVQTTCQIKTWNFTQPIPAFRGDGQMLIHKNKSANGSYDPCEITAQVDGWYKFIAEKDPSTASTNAYFQPMVRVNSNTIYCNSAGTYWVATYYIKAGCEITLDAWTSATDGDDASGDRQIWLLIT